MCFCGAVFLSGCGYLGDPLPPALKIPQRIRDLRVLQYGNRLIIDFTIPPFTTEGLPVKELGPTELLAGPATEPFDARQWEAGAERIPLPAAAEPGAVRQEIPAAKWAGKEIVFGVRASNAKGRKAAWSNLVSIKVQPPVPTPASVRAEATAGGVKLTWTGPAPQYRVLRQGPGEEKPSIVGETDKPEYLDATAQFDRTYEYSVQAMQEKAESETSAPVSITPKDVFPPAVPAGLTVVSGIGSIEVAWDRNTEPDLRGYRVYRAVNGGEFQRMGDMVDLPAFSDHNIQAGKRYRYAVSAVDQNGNESARSAPVEATAQ